MTGINWNYQYHGNPENSLDNNFYGVSDSPGISFQVGDIRSAPSGAREIQLKPLPEREDAIPIAWGMRIMPWFMLIGTFAMLALNIAKNGWVNYFNQPMMLLFPCMMIFGMISMLLGNRSGARELAKLNEARKEYLCYLTELRQHVRDIAAEQSEYVCRNYPRLGILDGSSLCNGASRTWTSHLQQADFGSVRIGVCAQDIAIRFLSPQNMQSPKLDPVTYLALQDFLKVQTKIPELPLIINLPNFSAVYFAMRSEKNCVLIRNLLLQLGSFYGPDRLLMSFISTNSAESAWDWAKWLPQVNHPYENDMQGSRRLFFPSVEDWERCFYHDLHSRHIFQPHNFLDPESIYHVIILCDDMMGSPAGNLLTSAGLSGVLVIDAISHLSDNVMQSHSADGSLNSPWKHGLCCAIRGDNVQLYYESQEKYTARVEDCSLVEAQACARILAAGKKLRPKSLLRIDQKDKRENELGLLNLLEISDLTKITPDLCWSLRLGRKRLRVPFGVDMEGVPVELDIKEGAEQGYGPHGLCIGATGSGKSEFLRTLILSMIVTHSPEELNFVLVDFKGGATFLGFEKLHHVAAVITNLEAEADLVQRMADALYGEMHRRQSILREAGNYANVGDYNREQLASTTPCILPVLFIVVDEFTELLVRFPEFADLFDMIGRLGRSLYIHMLLSSQRLSGMNTDKIMANLSYRIALKTFSSTDSYSAIGNSQAYTLPSQPGCGYLYCNSATVGEQLIRFNACYVSGPASSVTASHNQLSESISIMPVLSFSTEYQPREENTVSLEESIPPNSQFSLADRVINALAGTGKFAHPVWLAPLFDPPALSILLLGLKDKPSYTCNLAFPIGIIDKPYYQRQDLLILDCESHVACIGAPQTGKSHALRMIILSAAMIHSPEQVQFYCLDFGGGILYSIENLPHIGAVFGQHDVEGVQRVFADLLNIIRKREALCKAHHMESFTEYKLLRSEIGGEGISQSSVVDSMGNIFLVIDGFSLFKHRYEKLLESLELIVNQGLSYGVHVIISSAQWRDIRANIRDKLLSRIELYLGNSMDSELDPRAARRVPPSRPGRGMCLEVLADGSRKTYDFQLGVPRLDDRNTIEDLSGAIQTLITQAQELYPTCQAPRVRVLPERISRADILCQLQSEGSTLQSSEVLLGIDEEYIPVILDLAMSPIFLGFGAGESGKTTVIRNIISSLWENKNNSIRKNHVILCDYRRTLLDDSCLTDIYGYVSSTIQAMELMHNMVDILQARLPPPTLTPQELRERSWWEGADYYIVVDDYELVSMDDGVLGMSHNPLEVLVPFIPLAKDIGLRVIIMRGAIGAFRASLEPLLKTMREVNPAGIMMNGDPREDVTLGNNIRMAQRSPGRGVLVSPYLGEKNIQIAECNSLPNR